MPTIAVRQASLDDTRAISALFCSHISTWQRINPQGRVEDVPYDSLTIYERWLHGGAWMSLETGAIHLSHVLRGAGIALVAELDDVVVAYAEAYHGFEPAPFGAYVQPAHIIVRAGLDQGELKTALVNTLMERARKLKCQRFILNATATESDLIQRYELQPLARLHRFNLVARQGQVFYQAVEHLNPDPAQIRGWFMTVGRLASARQTWEMLWPRTWDALPEMRQRRTHRLHFSAAGHDAFVCCQQMIYDPRSADIYCWSPKMLTNQLLMAIRDWAHREGYRALITAVTEDTIKTLGPEAEPDGFVQEVFGVEL
jgi:nitroreductase